MSQPGPSRLSAEVEDGEVLDRPSSSQPLPSNPLTRRPSPIKAARIESWPKQKVKANPTSSTHDNPTFPTVLNPSTSQIPSLPKTFSSNNSNGSNGSTSLNRSKLPGRPRSPRERDRVGEKGRDREKDRDKNPIREWEQGRERISYDGLYEPRKRSPKYDDHRRRSRSPRGRHDSAGGRHREMDQRIGWDQKDRYVPGDEARGYRERDRRRDHEWREETGRRYSRDPHVGRVGRDEGMGRGQRHDDRDWKDERERSHRGHGYDDHDNPHHPRRPEKRKSSRSPKHRSQSKSSPPHRPSSPPMEEGEIEAEEESEVRPKAPSASPPPPPPETSNGEENANPFRATKKLSMRHRPTRPSPPRPPPDTPPPPPEDSAPPPPDTTPPVLSPTRTPGAQSPPRNRALEATKTRAKYDDRPVGSVPHAPNRNLLNPTTRPSTPARGGNVASVEHTPKSFRRPTLDEEMKRFGRTFKGTTTLDAYDIGSKLGEGTFGVVTKGVEIATKRPIALKKLLTHNPRDGVSVTTVREIKILKSLIHKNVVPILDMVVQPKSNSDKTGRHEIFMVFPYMDHDLCGLLGNPDFKMTHSLAKLLMRQILEGIAYIHAVGLRLSPRFSKTN